MATPGRYIFELSAATKAAKAQAMAAAKERPKERQVAAPTTVTKAVAKAQAALLHLPRDLNQFDNAIKSIAAAQKKIYGL
ncbi:hypothetical protein A2524_02980 [Candidatus Wolfebacteria bacterium RIFOXYD12_FULL_48_21]|uniref:Uncharacterized protein n=1 Tax=Candidatus Wolfebacteria bacterium RIFOXYD1_FULL_48_65 TaxID=1802561 RepID=A0A1F8E3X5_9BACT|nr:MAG: hypothetical protein A2610_02180 [Candidatus Wolfebacteria bacterium RIFOXYD1_FULL_48_65]OGM95029.1 MAG: hypothetical protein A2524_02980 [Candidatus Wolfebacteria bacterium RIFOXYD12_FULL_48_21]OGM97552.1 MAG: hypothetical protein A2532_02805 [Candidatus Wolfebacteria bacterium RIFOXYD2_FULL_48_11]